MLVEGVAAVPQNGCSNGNEHPSNAVKQRRVFDYGRRGQVQLLGTSHQSI